MDTPFQPTQIAFVLDNVADYQTLVAGIPEGTAVYVLDSHKDVLAQMEAITANYSDLSAIHLLSHGSSGALDLGSMSLNDDNVNDYAEVLSQIGSSLSENGDILLYGCNVAEDQRGVDFIGRLAQATGADIAASTDLTGARSLGGNWVLEAATDTIESKSLIIDNAYSETLAAPSLLPTSNPVDIGSDDDFHATIDITSVFGAQGVHFGSQWYTQVLMNDNGVIIFGTDTTNADAYVAGGIVSSTSPLISGYWTDLWTAGNVSYDINTTTKQIIFTWDNVGSYDQVGTGSERASFQIIISATGTAGDMGIQLRYSALNFSAQSTNPGGAQMGWSTGEKPQSSGGVSGTDFYEIKIGDQSANSPIGLPTTVGNTGLEGIWEFNLSNGGVAAVASGPAVPSAPDMTAGTDSGSSSTDNTTNDTTPTFTGTAAANITVNLYDTDGTTLLGTTTSDGSGNWSITTSALSAGVHSITAKANDGSTDSSASSVLSVTIDTTAPAASSAPDMTAGTDSGSSNSDNTTNDTTPTFTGTAEANSTITLYDTDGTTVLGTATANGSGNWSITSSALSAGSHTLTAKATDAAGNTSVASSGLDIVINTDSPTDITLSNATASTSGGANAVVGSLSSTDATVGDTFTYSLVAGTGDTNNASFNISGSNLRVNDPSALGAGTYSVLVRSTDVAGNTYDEAQSITISSNPTVTISADDTSLKAGQTATVTFTFNETPSGFDDSDISVSGGTLSAVSAMDSTHYSATFTPTADTASLAGSISIAAAAFTASGNDSIASNTLSITGDTLTPTPPTITSLASSSDSTPTVTGTTEPNATVTVVIAGATYTTTADGSGAWSVDTGSATPDSGTLTINANGNNSVSVTATDSAGNISSASTQTLVIDTTVPTFTSAATNSSGTKVILTYDSTLHTTTAGMTDFTVQVGGQTVVVSGVAISSSTVELTLASAITNGQTVTVAYTAPASNSTTSNSAVQDSSGNDAASLTTTTVTNSVPAPSSGGGGTTANIIGDNTLDGIVRTPTNTTTLGGTTVTTQTGTGTRTYLDDGGHTVTQNNVTVEAVQISAPINSSSTTTSVPLYWGESTKIEAATTASISAGVTLASEGNRAPTTTQTKASAIDDLIYYIQTTVSSTDSTKSNMLGGGSSFLTHLSNVDTLVVNKVVLSTTSTSSTTPATVSLNGTASAVTSNGVTDTPKEALVIDGTSLSSGSTVSLSNIEFGVLTGSGLNVVMTGTATQTVYTGTGTQTLTTSSQTQNHLYAGGGDDTFHITVPSSNSLSAPRTEAMNSLSTSNTFAGSIVNKTALYGEDGNDTTTVDGTGTQNVFVHGGSGIDSISYHGSINDYTITRDNAITYVHSNTTSKTDLLLNVESIQFDDGTYTITNNQDMTKIASLYQQVLGRQAEVDGFQYWASAFDNGDSIGAIATSFVRSSEYFNNTNNVWDNMNNDQRIETFYELMLGRASDAAGKAYWMNAINNGISIEEIAGSFVESAEMQGICPAAQEWNFTA